MVERSRQMCTVLNGVASQSAASSGKRIRCERCLRPQSHCLCALVTVLPSKTRIVVLQHSDESRHALNTARLAVLGLENAELCIGRQFDAAHWRVPGYRPYLLFPGENAQVLTPACEVSLPIEPCLLVVPDGTWRHARQLIAQHPELAVLPRLTLPEGRVSAYRVRHAADDRALSTIEAVVHALNALESPASFDALLAPFEALVQGQIKAMGNERYQQDHVRREGRRTLEKQKE